MGFFDLFHKKGNHTNDWPAEQVSVSPQTSPWNVSTQELAFSYSCSSQILKEFIAFDVETTGLSPTNDRIVELGAVLFVDGKPIQTFSTLVNPGIEISATASAVNHITDDMLKKAPNEIEVFENFVDFLGEALSGNIIMCAHNAKFDFNFLSNTLKRLGYDGTLKYVDTLHLARKFVSGVANYKQYTLETYFGLSNENSHRAASDALNCGLILLSIIQISDEYLQDEKRRAEAYIPSQSELAVCAYIQKIISDHGEDTKYLSFRKNSGKYVVVSYVYTILKFKFAKKGQYVIISKDLLDNCSLISEPCTASEGGTDYIRVYFTSVSDLEVIIPFVLFSYNQAKKAYEDYSKFYRHADQEMQEALLQSTTLTDGEVDNLLKIETSKKKPPCNPPQITNNISRDMVDIQVTHNRVPLSDIKNANDWEKGFEAGFKYYEKGDVLRKEGELQEAIFYFDKARFNGYNAPALYTSYALAYRALKEYGNEILILEEGILRAPMRKGEFEARKNKAINLLFKQQEAIRQSEKEKKDKEEKKLCKEQQTHKQETNTTKKKVGRRIRKLDDAGNIIKEYDSLTCATSETGINSKSIRDAAKGIQKHAGGFCWAYVDSADPNHEPRNS